MGFPTARRLVFDVCEELSSSAGDPNKVLRRIGHKPEELRQFRDSLMTSAMPSVDAFLENRKEFEIIGKRAIAACLIPHETEASLTRKADRLSWYEYLFHQLPASFEAFASAQLSVITFNYDRSFEYFLFRAVVNSFGIKEDDQGAQLVASIPVVHVYGQLCRPHFMGAGGRSYSPDVTEDTVRCSAEGIRILHEGSGTTDEFTKAQALVEQAEVLCFLGFSYHPTNLERLNVVGLFPGSLFGCCYGMGKNDIARAESRLRRDSWDSLIDRFGQPDEDALEFLRRYWVFD